MKPFARFLAVLLILTAFSCGNRAQGDAAAGSRLAGAAPGRPRIEIAFLNHSPVLAALVDADKLLASYGDRIEIIRYDLETEQGEQFIKGKKLAGHVPIAIFVNGTMEVKLKIRNVKFYSFPEGAGTQMMAGGSWTVDDLRQAIERALGSTR
jgi:hypothetical protein